jgi:hypothetical protein
MERLRHATRSKGIVASNSASWSGGRAPAAVRKLGVSGDWNFKPAGCRLPDVEGNGNSSVEDEDVGVEVTGAMEEPDTSDEENNEIESYYRFIGETEAIRDLFLESAVCGACKKGSLEVSFDSSCIATSVHTRCTTCHTHCASTTTQTSIPQPDGRMQNTRHAANVLLVLSQLLSGNGGTETSRLIGMLDLPTLSISETAFPYLEIELAKYIIPYTEEILAENLRKEVLLYAEKNADFDYEVWYKQYKAQPSLIDLQAIPLLTVAYDMAWQKRSSGHRYDSHSGHAILVGVFTNLPVGLTIMNKHCRICLANEEPTDHDCREGPSDPAYGHSSRSNPVSRKMTDVVKVVRRSMIPAG